MSCGLRSRSWFNTTSAEVKVQGVPMRARATASAAMTMVSFFDAVLLVVVAAALGMPLAAWWTWVALASVVGALALNGHYRPRITLSVAREAGSLAACASAPFLILALAKVPGTSTAMLVVTGAVAAGGIVVARCGQYWLMRVMRAQGWFAERTLFVGAGDVSAKLASTLREHPEYGLRPVGFLDEVDSAGLPLPLFGGVHMLRMVLSEEHVDRVIVGFGVTREAEMVEVFRACEDASVEIHVLPRFFELATAMNSRNVDDVWGYPLLRLRRSLMRRHARLVKRVFDTSVAAFALLAVFPLYAAIAAVVKFTSPGPIHFRQQRVGGRGVIVEVLKFRSMRVNLRSDVEWNPANDSVTRIGRVLRVTGLDELPQLWNILRGDMSFVGPRPERPFFVEQFKAEVPRYADRHRVPVGLTGLAQVHGLRGDTPIDERARLDNQYIENWSLWRDVVILLQTLSAVIRNSFEGSRRVKLVHDAAAPAIGAVGQTSVGGDGGRLGGHLAPAPSSGRRFSQRPQQQWVLGGGLHALDRPYHAAPTGVRDLGHSGFRGAHLSRHPSISRPLANRPVHAAASHHGSGGFRTRPHGLDPAERPRAG